MNFQRIWYPFVFLELSYTQITDDGIFSFIRTRVTTVIVNNGFSPVKS